MRGLTIRASGLAELMANVAQALGVPPEANCRLLWYDAEYCEQPDLDITRIKHGTNVRLHVRSEPDVTPAR